MPSDRRYLYWDACVFLSFLNNDGDRIGAIESVLAEVEEDDGLSIATSVLSRVEVAYCGAEQSRQALDGATEAKLDSMWADRSVVALVEVNDEIARRARSLVRDGLVSGRTIKPLDAVHLATAQWVSALEVHTYDKSLLAKFGKDFTCAVCEPHPQQGRLPLAWQSGGPPSI